MKFAKITAAATAIALMGGTAMAQDSGVYVNVGVDAVEFDSYGLTGRVGYLFNEIFAVEGQVGFGISDDEIEPGLEVGVDYNVAAFAKAHLPVSEQTKLFVRGGYHFTQVGYDVELSNLTAAPDVDDFDFNIDTDGFAVGAGAEFAFDEFNGIRVEYTYYDLGSFSASDVSSDGVTTQDIADGLVAAGLPGQGDFDAGSSDVFSISYVRRF